MTHVEIEERINAPAEDVWDCYLGSRAEELAVGVYAESITTEGQGIGSVRTSILLNGEGVVKERIDEFDEQTLHCGYSVIDPGPMPFSNYRGQIDVTRDGPNACFLKLQADYLPPAGVTEQESIDLYLQNNKGGIAKLKVLLGLD